MHHALLALMPSAQETDDLDPIVMLTLVGAMANLLPVEALLGCAKSLRRTAWRRNKLGRGIPVHDRARLHAYADLLEAHARGLIDWDRLVRDYADFAGELTDTETPATCSPKTK